MQPIKICTWLWGDKYNDAYVRKWADGLHRHVKEPHELIIFKPQSEDKYLTKIPGCFARLRMFCKEWQNEVGLKKNERIVCTDLDVVFTGTLDPIFAREETLVILAGANAINPCNFNGSLIMLRGGYHYEVWQEFSLEEANKTKYFSFPDDQGWLWNKLPNAATWQVGPSSGIYSFQKPGWPGDDKLPAGARMVVFPGWRDPIKFQRLQWVKDHWS